MRLEQEKGILLNAVAKAGMAVRQLQVPELEIKNKNNNDIVTQADLLANEILQNALLGAFPADGWLSEETVDDIKRLHCRRVWIVDPIDGTREYAAGIPEYALSVALVEDGLPVLSVVFNPAANELYYAEKGGGAWLNETKLDCRPPQTEKMIFLASRSEMKRGEWDRFEETFQVRPVGSIAYKLALLAAGQAHATFSLGPKSEWDIAAGVLIVQEAGGLVTDKTGQQFIFNSRNIRVNGIIAIADTMNASIFSMITS